MEKQEYQEIAVVGIFAMAMGYLECAVVLYLRMLYCPNGFGFPFEKFMGPDVLPIEVLREISTIVMLLGAAYLAASSLKNRFAYFLFAFAVWDLFYYVWLKATLNWPESLLTYDLLFLIPWPWVGPVLAPVIGSLTMILLANCLLRSENNPRPGDWALLFAGGFVILYTFLIDYGRLIASGNHFKDLFSLPAYGEFQKIFSHFVPGNYNWVLFAAGEAVILAGIFRFWRRPSS